MELSHDELLRTALIKSLKSGGRPFKEVCSSLGLHKSTVSNWTHAKRRIGYSSLHRIRKILPFLNESHVTPVPNGRGRTGRTSCLGLTNDGEVTVRRFLNDELPLPKSVPSLESGAKGTKPRRVRALAVNKGAGALVYPPSKVMADIAILCSMPSTRKRLLRVCDHLEPLNIQLGEILRAIDQDIEQDKL